MRLASRTLVLAALALLGPVLSAPASAQKTVTIGSSLSAPPDTFLGCVEQCAAVITTLPTAARAPGGVASPVKGTVVRWRVRSAGFAPTPVRFRVIRPKGAFMGGFLFMGAGTSATAIPPLDAISEHPVNMPIRAGDLIGLDCCSDDLNGYYFRFRTGAAYRYFALDGLPDGSTMYGYVGTEDVELTVNADVVPSSGFAFRSKALENGKMKIVLRLPNPGKLKARDRHKAKRKRLLRKAFRRVRRPGKLSLVMKPTRLALRRLETKASRVGEENARLKTGARLTFTPRFGSPNTRVLRVRLRL